jgi:glycerol-3-phosphate acyltransferase PlsX
MKIGIDAMGGDYAPLEAVKGVIEASQLSDLADVELFLVGRDDEIRSCAQKSGLDLKHVKIVHADEVIGMSEHPTRAVSQKKESSINIGMHLLSEGKLDAFASAGNTGAMLVSSLYFIKAIDGINRPSLSTVLPKTDGTTGVLLDIGLNSDVKPETLYQFALLGSLYAQHVYHINEPRVGLLSIGEEKEKGNLLTQAAYPIFESSKTINFIGNIEGRHLFTDKADVVVCDGFTGNVILKTCEGFFYNLMQRGIQDQYLDRFNFEHYGGSAILGINKPVIIGHGISKSETFISMVRLSKEVVLSGLSEKIRIVL